MGKSGNRKKKGGNGHANNNNKSNNNEPSPATVSSKQSETSTVKKHTGASPAPSPVTGTGVSATAANPAGNNLPKMEQFAAVFLRRAHELKEEGNRRFQSKDYQGALDHYEQALKLTPRNHSDRAIFHSNRAACLMQMKPVQYESVVKECTLALEVHPRFGRALFRRARALEALGKRELALHDVQMMLQDDENNPDALELAKRLRTTVGNQEEAQQDSEGRTPITPLQPSYAGTSPAALGASAVRGTPSPPANRGPTLPARPVPKKKAPKTDQPSLKVANADVKAGTTTSVIDSNSSIAAKSQQSVEVKEELKDKVTEINGAKVPESENVRVIIKPLQKETLKVPKKPINLQTRPLKLIYDHDIRLARMPINCKFRDLREIIRKRFPASKAVLVKYKDMDGDLVTITSTEELRLAEAAAMSEGNGKASKDDVDRNDGGSVADASFSVPLRLHVVEVSIEQEPVVEEDECFEEEVSDVTVEIVGQSNSSTEDETSIGDDINETKEKTSPDSDRKKVDADNEEETSKEVEIDEWLLDFAQLFRTHIGVDPDAHIDLHELGMELCSEALEETVTSEAAQPLFEAAACKFQEVAALAFFNWGNVHMCAARKRIPLEENGDKTIFHERLQQAFEWARTQYELARVKYDEALQVKSDFYEGVLALGQECFESAKLRWSLAVASQVDLSTWDSVETIELFRKAEEKMQVASEMWDKLEEQRIKEAMESATKKPKLKPDVKGGKENPQELTEAETREQCRAMRFQINLFWGNILFEHSQVEFKLGMSSWKALLNEAVVKFELAGASASDIIVVLKNHVANTASPEELEGLNPELRDHILSAKGNIAVKENADESNKIHNDNDDNVMKERTILD